MVSKCDEGMLLVEYLRLLFRRFRFYRRFVSVYCGYICFLGEICSRWGDVSCDMYFLGWSIKNTTSSLLLHLTLGNRVVQSSFGFCSLLSEISTCQRRSICKMICILGYDDYLSKVYSWHKICWSNI